MTSAATSSGGGLPADCARDRLDWMKRVLPLGLVRVHRRAGADEVAVAVGVVDAADEGPELAFAQPRPRVGGLLAAVLVRPRVADQRRGRVRGVLQDVVGAVGAAFLDGPDLLADADHR